MSNINTIRKKQLVEECIQLAQKLYEQSCILSQVYLLRSYFCFTISQKDMLTNPKHYANMTEEEIETLLCNLNHQHTVLEYQICEAREKEQLVCACIKLVEKIKELTNQFEVLYGKANPNGITEEQFKKLANKAHYQSSTNEELQKTIIELQKWIENLSKNCNFQIDNERFKI